MNILAIGAHPDDIELGCGGLLLKAAKQGHNISMYTLTRGSASGDPGKRTLLKMQMQNIELYQSSVEYVKLESVLIDDLLLSSNNIKLKRSEFSI